MGMRSHISCMTCNIPYRTAFSVWNVIDLCMPLHVHFRWGVSLLGESFYGALLTPSWRNIFQVPEVHRESNQVQEINYEKGWTVAYSYML